MTLITNKSLSYVLEHLGDENKSFNAEIARVSFDKAIELFKRTNSSCEIYYDATDYNKFINYLNSHDITYVNSYSKKIDEHSLIICDINNGTATILLIYEIDEI
jgi:hypothetical protein